MIKLPSLSAVPAKSPESPAKQHIGRSNEVHDVPLSDPAVQRKLSIGKGADASKSSQSREVRSELPHGGITVRVALPPGRKCTAVLQY